MKYRVGDVIQHLYIHRRIRVVLGVDNDDYLVTSDDVEVEYTLKLDIDYVEQDYKLVSDIFRGELG